MKKNPAVDAWLVERGHPLDPALWRVREIVLETDERITESIKWKTPTFEYKGNIASFSPSKNFVSLMFYRGAEIPGDLPHLEGEGRLVRTMRFADLAQVNDRRAELEAVIRTWCAWRDS